MRARFRALMLPLVFVTVLGGCASDGIEVSTTYDPLAAFPAQATFAWDDRANKLPSDERLLALDLGPVIKESAEEALAKHGYRPVTGEIPNFLVSYQAVAHSWIGADNSRAIGSVSLLLVDASSGRRVWLGFGRSEINVGLTRAERKQRMAKAIEKMLENFPPNQPGA